MRLTAIMMAVSLAVAAAPAQEVGASSPHDLTIYLLGEQGVPARMEAPALGFAARMLSDVGVRVTWRSYRHFESDPRGHYMIIEFDEKPRDPADHAMGYALPFRGSGITILYSRFKWAERDPYLVPNCLRTFWFTRSPITSKGSLAIPRQAS